MTTLKQFPNSHKIIRVLHKLRKVHDVLHWEVILFIGTHTVMSDFAFTIAQNVLFSP
jgi:hypothetical protein